MLRKRKGIDLNAAKKREKGIPIPGSQIVMPREASLRTRKAVTARALKKLAYRKELSTNEKEPLRVGVGGVKYDVWVDKRAPLGIRIKTKNTREGRYGDIEVTNDKLREQIFEYLRKDNYIW